MLTSMEVIEHVDNQVEFVQNCVDRLKLGGLLFMSTIETGPLSILVNKVFAEYILKAVEIGWVGCLV